MTGRWRLMRSGTVGGQAEGAGVQPAGDSHRGFGVARAGGYLVVAEREEAAVLHRGEFPGDRTGFQELLFLRGRRGAVVVDDDALGVRLDHLLPGHRRKALLEAREDVRSAAEADQGGRRREPGAGERRGLAAVVIEHRDRLEPGDLAPRGGYLRLHGADHLLGTRADVEDLAQVPQVLVGVVDADRVRARLYTGAGFGQGEGLDAELGQALRGEVGAGLQAVVPAGE